MKNEDDLTYMFLCTVVFRFIYDAVVVYEIIKLKLTKSYVKISRVDRE
jgi:hypothetical protein